MLESPLLGRSPIRLLNAEGMRIDPQVSEPNPAAAKLAATAAPVPPLEPPGNAPRIVRIACLPYQGPDTRDAIGILMQVRLRQDDRARLAAVYPPAPHSRVGLKFANATEPPVVGM